MRYAAFAVLGFFAGILVMDALFWWPHEAGCRAYFERHPEAPFCRLTVKE